MSTRTKIILWLCLLGIADTVAPVPILAATGIYIAATRPGWFRMLVKKLYDERLGE